MRKIYSSLLIFTFVLTPFSSVGGQETRGAGVRPNASSPTTRIALVIGNANYQNTSRLANPVNDARDMSAALKKVGFEVLEGENLTAEQMKRLISEFGEKLTRKKGVGLFFYAGHGVQINGRNYLIPVDVKNLREKTMEFDAVDVNRVLGEMDEAGSHVNIVILDACRNNPFERSWRNASQGLAEMRAPKGTLIAYATAPGKVASDGTGRNGLFTSQILKQLNTPNVLIETAFKRVGEQVSDISKGTQEPYLSQSLRGDFYFVREKGETNSAKTELPEEIAVSKRDRLQVEREAWLLIQNSRNPGDFRFFLKEFPNGAYQSKAQIRLEQTVWDAVKNSNDKTKLEEYLQEFGRGANASLARIKLRQITRVQTTEQTTTNDKEANNGTEIKTNKSSSANTENLRAGTVQKNSLGMEFAYIPPGTFQMGSNNGGEDEKPVHTVQISKGYWMGIYEVTQDQWEKVMGSKLSHFKDCGQCPAGGIAWSQAQEFIKKINSQTNDGTTYRLPTEAEWEYAARAGATGEYAGNIDSMAWNQTNSGGKTDPVRVGQKSPNNWGLYDVHGNAQEWVQDWYGSYPSLSITDPTGPKSGSQHISRGGSIFMVPRFHRLAYRTSRKGYPDHDNGFRLVRTLD